MLSYRTKVVSNRIGQKQDRIIQMIRSHRRIQDKVMEQYRKREIEFMNRLKEMTLERCEELYSIEEEEDRASLNHG